MAKILGNTVLSGNISKIVETPDNFLVNGHTYDKNTFSPISFDFCPLISSASNEMSLYQTAYVNGYWYKNYTNNGYLLDSSDPSICYVVTQSIYGGTGVPYIHKLIKNPNGSTTVIPYTAFSGYNSIIDLVGQDNQKIYFIVNRNYNGAYSYIGYVDKVSMTGAYVNLNTGSIKVLKVTDMYIYISTPSVNALTMNIGKYNKLNNTITWLMTDTLATGYYSDTITSDLQSNGVFYCMRDGQGMGMTGHFMAYRKYTLDISKDLVTASNVSVDMTKYPNSQILINSTSSMGVGNSLINYTDSVTGKKYITHVVYNKGTTSVGLTQSDSAIYTYEVIDDNNWKLVSYTSFTPIIYKAMLTTANNATLIMAYESGVHIYSWNSAAASYSKVTSIDTSISCIGLDSNNNIFVQYSDTSLELISNVMPINIYADFENDIYQYKGVDISSNVILYAQNYQNKYLSTSIELTLYGNVKFTSNGLRKITVTTSNLDKLQIPITITGSGTYKVSYKII